MKEEKRRGRNPISLVEVGVIVVVVALGFTLLNSNMNNRMGDLKTFLETRMDDLNTSLNARIDNLPRSVTVAPFPVAAKLPREKLKEIQKSELLTAEPGEKIITVEAGDYVVLPLLFELGELATIEWQAVGVPEQNLVDFYLLDEAGNVYRFDRTAKYSTTWMSPNDATFYLYFSNVFEPTQPKELWFRLVESE